MIHYTSRFGAESPGVPKEIQDLLPWERVVSILHRAVLRYSQPFDTVWPVACFTQSTRRALSGMGRNVGIGFHKQFIWDAGGGPAYYVRGDQWTDWQNSNLSEPARSMGVRLWPGWEGPPEIGIGNRFVDQLGTRSEWLHEREWRLPRPNETDWGWAFPREAVAFLLSANQRVKDDAFATLASWGGDVAWVESLPISWGGADDFPGVDGL